MKKIFLALSCIVAFSACQKKDTLVKLSPPDLEHKKLKFDYTFFHSCKNLDLEIDISDIENMSGHERYSCIVARINEKFHSNLSLTEMDTEIINNIEGINMREVSTFLSEADVVLVDHLYSDMGESGFDVAIQNFEYSVVDLNPSIEDFERYNAYANVLMLIDNYDSSILLPDIQQASPCAKAIAANALATVGLVACGTGLLCVAAIAAKILAVDAVIAACK